MHRGYDTPMSKPSYFASPGGRFAAAASATAFGGFGVVALMSDGTAAKVVLYCVLMVVSAGFITSTVLATDGYPREVLKQLFFLPFFAPLCLPVALKLPGAGVGIGILLLVAAVASLVIPWVLRDPTPA